MPDQTTITGTADLYDAHGEALEICETQFGHYGGRAIFSGPVVTIRCFEDNALVKQVLAEPGEGRVLVIDGGGSLRTALMGDLIAGSGVENGWAGVIVNGAVRDSAVLRELPLGIRALGTVPRKSGKTGAGERDVPVEIGGATFTPGRVLVSDGDGIVLLSATAE